MDEIVLRILKTAKERGMNQKQLAEKLEIHPQVVTDWKTKSTSYRQYIDKLSDLLGVSADYLLTGQESAPAAGDPELAAFLDAVSPLTAEERAKVQGFIQGLIAQRK